MSSPEGRSEERTAASRFPWLGIVRRCVAVAWLLVVAWVVGWTTGLLPAFLDLIGEDTLEAMLGASGVDFLGGVLLASVFVTNVLPAWLFETLGIRGFLIVPSRPEPYGFPSLTFWGIAVIYGLPTLILVVRWVRRARSQNKLEP